MWLRDKTAKHKLHWSARKQRHNKLTEYTRAVKPEQVILPAYPEMIPYGNSLDIVLYGSTKAERVPNPPCKSYTVRERREKINADRLRRQAGTGD